MKIGCCVNMLAKGDDRVGAFWIPALKKCGYDYVELPLAQVMELGEASFRELLETLRGSGMPCECCNNFFQERVRLTGGEVSMRQVGDYIRRTVERAARLGASVIVFGSSGAKNVPAGFDRERAFGQLVQVLHLAADVCAAYGVTIVIEPLNSGESNIILTLSEGTALMEATAHPQVKLLADYYHFRRERDSEQNLRRLAGRLEHVHFARADTRGFPLEDCGEYERFFGLLHEGGYRGRCSIEAYSSEPERDLSRGLSMLARYR